MAAPSRLARRRAVCKPQSGAALLLAMLTVTLVATLSAAALWRHWRGVEVEGAERARVQARWLLVGALDWARLILREDANQSAVDALTEPWAVPLREARLSTFLAMDARSTSPGDLADATFLSGEIIDLQSRLNLTNLIEDGKINTGSASAFARLFAALGLPPAALSQLLERWRLANDAASASPAALLLPPQDLDQLAWFGLAPDVIARLRPYVTILPGPTPVNLNTASAEVIYAASGVELADARRFVAQRTLQPLNTLADAETVGRLAGARLKTTQLSVGSRFFEIHALLRNEQTLLQQSAVVQRDGLIVKVLSIRNGPPPPSIKTASPS